MSDSTPMPGLGGTESRAFPCTRCGACCRNLGKSPLFTRLDRGDGICRHLNTNTNLCRIYEKRPKICRVTDMFDAFAEQLTWTDYVALNLQACHELRALGNVYNRQKPRTTPGTSSSALEFVQADQRHSGRQPAKRRLICSCST